MEKGKGRGHLPALNFGATVCKTVCPMLSDRCPVYLFCLSVWM